MRKFIATLFLLLAVSSVWSQLTTQIGTGTSVPGNTLYAPVYRYSNSSTTDIIRSNIVYTSSELSAAGIFSGSLIAKIAFYKVGIDSLLGSGSLGIWMNNSATQPPLSTTTAWTDIASNFTQVFADNAYVMHGDTGWVEYILSTPFLYSGNSLEIAFEFNCNSISGNPASGPFMWMYTPGFDTYIQAGVSTTATPPATLSANVAAYKQRPNIQITYASATGTDAGLSNLTNGPFCSGSANFSVDITASGSVDIDSATIGWSVNGVAQAPVQYVGAPLTQGNSVSVPLGSYNLASGVSYDIQAYLMDVNGVIGDLFSINDTTGYTGLSTALSGNYTINSAVATGGNNFQTFTALATALNATGVCGPVVVDVVSGSGPYTEQFLLGSVNGTSNVNTITINGHNEVIAFAATVSADRATVKLEGTDHVTIDSLVVGATGTYGIGVQLISDADSNTISNCTLNILASSTSTNYAGLVINGSATSPTATGSSLCDYNTIVNNTISGGYLGISLVANGTTSMIYGNKVINNTIQDFYTYGVYVNGNDGTLIEGNDISRPTRSTGITSFYGVYHTGVSYNMMVSKNRIHNSFGGDPGNTGSSYGVYHTNTDAILGNENYVINNLIYNFQGGGTQNGFLTGGSDYTIYYHNTVALDDNTATCATCATRGFYLQTNTATGLQIVDNNFVLTRTGGGDAQGIYFAVNVSGFLSDHNNIYVATAGAVKDIGYINGAGYNSLASWTAASLNDSNSVSMNPLFVNPSIGNYTPGAPGFNNLGTPVGVSDDINGNVRNLTTPDIGAIEFDVASVDAGVNNIITSACAGTDSIYVTVQNFGLTAITSVMVNCLVNGVPTPNSGNTFAVNIPASGSVNLNMGEVTFVSGASYTASAFTSLPNNITDPNNANDTTTIPVNLALSGNYTINSTQPTGGANFQTFADVESALNTMGVCGPVVIDVVPGTGPYTQQVTFGQINGVSAINTVTIHGHGEVLNFDAPSTAKYIIRLNGTDYFTIDSLKLVSISTTYGIGFLLSGNADYNTIDGCEIDLSSITSTTTTNSCGIAISGSVTSPTTGGNNGNLNTFSNNYIHGGAAGGPYYGITLYGTTGSVGCDGNKVVGNRVEDYYTTGIQASLTSSSTIESNDLSRPNRTAGSTVDGVVLTGAANPKAKVIKNRIHNTHGGNTVSTGTVTAIDVSSDGGGVTQEILVANNAVYNVNNIGIQYGVYLNASLYTNVYHNSICFDNTLATGTSTARGVYMTGTNDNIHIKNNVVSITRTGTGAFYGLYYSTLPLTYTSDNNDVYVASSTGGNYFGYNGSAQIDLASWLATSFVDSNSVEADPLFASAATGDLTPASAIINDIGEDLTTDVPNDILGNVRSTTPDPGAFEFTPSNNDASVLTVVTSTCPGTDSVFVRVQNLGIIPLTSVIVTATANGTPSTSSGSIFSVSLAPGADTTLNLGTFTFVAGTSYSIEAYSALPNGSTDANHLNDTISLNIDLGLSGNYTVNSGIATGGTNFNSFTDLAQALNIRGVCSAVVVDVVTGSGPYNEQITINQVIGASAVNTITINGHQETLTFAPASTAKFILFLNGTDYLTVDSLRIIGTNATYGFGVLLSDNADNNTISNCEIDLSAVTSTTATNSAGICISGSVTSPTTAGNNGNNNALLNNRILGSASGGPYYGISLYGTTGSVGCVGNIVAGNTLVDFYNNGIRLNLTSDCDIIGNDLSRPNRTNAGTLEGIYLTGLTNLSARVMKNRIHNSNGSNPTSTSAIYCIDISTDGALGQEITVANNFVYDINNNGSAYGFYVSGSLYSNFYHNSISLDNSTSTAGLARGIFLTGACDFNNIKNNAVSVTRGGTGIMYGLYYGHLPATIGSDHNDVYINAPQTSAYFGYNGSNQLSLTDWKTATQLDSNSLDVNPQYASVTDLHASSPFLNDRGELGLVVDEDIDGDVRCPLIGCAGSTLRPDIGADEFLGVPITVDLGVEALSSPAQQSCYTNTESVIVQIKNFNTQQIDFSVYPVTVNASVTGPNGTTFTPITINSGTLDADSVLSVTMSSAYDMSVPGTYIFNLFTSQSSDANNANDTISNADIIFSVGTNSTSYAEVCAGSAYELILEDFTGSVQWQSYDIANSVWVNETAPGFDSVSYTINPTVLSYYRAMVCGTFASVTDTISPIVVTTPVVQSDTICTGQTGTLIATGMGTRSWYTAMTGGSLIYSGDTFSAIANADTTFYVESTLGLAGGNGTLKITEIDVDNITDRIEIQNLSSQPINTAGWVVAISNSYTVINTVNSVLWNLPATIAPGQILYKEDGSTSPNYWGSNILWNPSQQGWAMIIDNNGVIRDLVVMDWPATALSTFSAVINGFNISFGPNDWVGDGVDLTTIPTGTTINRIGSIDNNDASDFVRASTTIGTINAGLSPVMQGGSCGSGRIPVTLKVEQAPIVNLGSDTTQCTGTVTIDAGNAGNSFVWSNTETTQSIVVATSGSYVVTVTSANGCSSSDAINVNIASYPIVSLGPDTNYCGISSTVLSASGLNNTFSWSTGSTSPFITVTAGGTYSVTVTNPSGCASVDSVALSFNPAATVNAGNDTTQCGGQIDVMASAGGVSYIWNNGETTQTITVAQSGTYRVTLTDGNNCSASDSVLVTINALPVVSLADTTQCGGNVTLDAGNTGSSFVWNNNANSQAIVVGTTGSYAVTVTSTEGCTSTASANVQIFANPTLTFNLPDSVCSDAGTIALSASPVGGVFTGSGVNGSSFDPAAVTVGTSTVTYSYTDGNGCSADASQSIEVYVCTGIEDAIETFGVQIYPNPTSGILQLNFEKLPQGQLLLQLFSVDGKLVYSTSHVELFNTLDLSLFAGGVYSLRLSNTETVFTAKVIIE